MTMTQWASKPLISAFALSRQGRDDVYVMPRESITCVRWRARTEIEKHPHRQTMSATAFIVSGICHDAEQERHMIEYGCNIADHTARAPEDARVIS
jgi:hypothetical protein